MMMSYTPRRRDSCGICLRYFLAVANIIFLLLGGGVVAVFMYVEMTQVYFVKTVLVTELVVASTRLLSSGGCMLVVAALVGFAAVASRRPCVTAAHFILLIIVFLAAMSGILCSLVFRIFMNEGVMDRMQETLQRDYGVRVNTSSWNSKVTNDWDKAQSLWKCCAVEDQGWSAYRTSAWYQLQPGTPHGGANAKPFVPRSCCVIDDSGYITEEDLRQCQTTLDGPPARRQGSQFTGRVNPSLHYRGCYESAKDYLLYADLSWFAIVVAVGGTVSAIVLIGIVVSVAYYLVRKNALKRQAEITVAGLETQMSLTQNDYH